MCGWEYGFRSIRTLFKSWTEQWLLCSWSWRLRRALFGVDYLSAIISFSCVPISDPCTPERPKQGNQRHGTGAIIIRSWRTVITLFLKVIARGLQWPAVAVGVGPTAHTRLAPCLQGMLRPCWCQTSWSPRLVMSHLQSGPVDLGMLVAQYRECLSLPEESHCFQCVWGVPPSRVESRHWAGSIMTYVALSLTLALLATVPAVWAWRIVGTGRAAHLCPSLCALWMACAWLPLGLGWPSRQASMERGMEHGQ